MKSRLQAKYENEIRKKMSEEFSYTNPFEVPTLKSIVLSASLKDIATDAKAIERMSEELFKITGQKPVVTKAKKSIAAFKLREQTPVGLKVTLRKHIMYHFLDRFVNIALPRVKDFRGLDGRKFDGNGNYATGFKEHIIFPEIDYDKVDKIWGMNIVFCTSAKSDKEAKALLSNFDFPFNN